MALSVLYFWYCNFYIVVESSPDKESRCLCFNSSNIIFPHPFYSVHLWAPAIPSAKPRMGSWKVKVPHLNISPILPKNIETSEWMARSMCLCNAPRDSHIVGSSLLICVLKYILKAGESTFKDFQMKVLLQVYTTPTTSRLIPFQFPSLSSFI